ncbi:MAG: hypothetical protein N4A43_01195 [Alphaproteobacteria bacterium]|jgi:capsule polysaccharide export protein KpsE/RkpR|nr:hypothetical protein [Alphaproteobacteria bacterium]
MYNNSLDANAILAGIKSYKKQVIIIFIICFCLSCLASSFITKKHTAFMVVSPAVHDLKEKDKSEKEDSSIKQGESDFNKFLYLLTSKDVAKKLNSDKEISSKLKAKFSLSSLLLYGRIYSKNDIETTQNYIQNNLNIENIKNTNMKRVTLKHSNPKFAKYLLKSLYKQADDIIKNREKNKNGKEIAFIKKQLKTSNTSKNSEVFLDLLQHQLQIEAMLGVDLPYSADTVENISVSSIPNSPSIPLIVLFITLMSGSFWSLLFIYIKENK